MNASNFNDDRDGSAPQPAGVVPPWKLRRDGQEWPIHDVQELRDFAASNRISESDYVWNPTLERWMYAREVAEIAGHFSEIESAKKSGTLNRVSIVFFLFGLLASFIFWPVGLVLIIASFVMAAYYYATRPRGESSQVGLFGAIMAVIGGLTILVAIGAVIWLFVR